MRKTNLNSLSLLENPVLIRFLKSIGVQISFCTDIAYNKILEVRNSTPHTQIFNLKYLIIHYIQTKSHTKIVSRSILDIFQNSSYLAFKKNVYGILDL